MTVFKLPDLGEGLSEAEILRWHVKVGDHIEVDAPMLSVETAKAVVEVPSPVSGTVTALHAQPGDRIEIGAPLIEFAADAAALAGGRARHAHRGAVTIPAPWSDTCRRCGRCRRRSARSGQRGDRAAGARRTGRACAGAQPRRRLSEL